MPSAKWESGFFQGQVKPRAPIGANPRATIGVSERLGLITAHEVGTLGDSTSKMNAVRPHPSTAKGVEVLRECENEIRSVIHSLSNTVSPANQEPAGAGAEDVTAETGTSFVI